MSCLTTISRLAGWHLTTDWELSFTSFVFPGLQRTKTTWHEKHTTLNTLIYPS